jgi:cytochrome P450
MCMVFGSTLYSLLIVDENVADKVQRIDNLPKAKEAYYKLKPVIGSSSMITLEGEHWQRLRKMFNSAFSQNHLETLVPEMVTEALVFAKKLESASKQDKVILLFDALVVSNLFTII